MAPTLSRKIFAAKKTGLRRPPTGRTAKWRKRKGHGSGDGDGTVFPRKKNKISKNSFI